MAIMANNTSNFTRELTPAGMHLARCYMMVHIGTVQETINGKNTTLNKVLIGWELPNVTKVYNEQRGAEVVTFLKEFTLSLGDKAILRKTLASWRGQDFTKEELENFDITKVLGVACCLNIIHTPKKSNPSELREDLTAVVPMMQGAMVPPAVHKVVKFEWDMPNWEVFGSVPVFAQNKIKNSDEYRRYVAQYGVPAQLQQAAVQQSPVQQPVAQGAQPVFGPTGWTTPGGYQQTPSGGYAPTYQQPGGAMGGKDDLPF